MKYTAVIVAIVMLPVMVQASRNVSLAEKCEKSFIWVEYDKTLEKECRPMWDTMTKQILKSNNEIWKTEKVPVIAPKSTSAKPAKINQTKEKVISTIASPVKSSSENKIILRNNWNDPRVQYAYNISWGNMDFILTIEAESRWDMNAIWDQGQSFWLCQIHKRWNGKLQQQYRDLKTDEEKIKLCYDQYMGWVKRWVIKTRLYWYNYRKARAYLFTIKQ